MEFGPLAADVTFHNTSRGLPQQNPDILQFAPEEEINGFQESTARPLSASPLTHEPSQTRDEDMDAVIVTVETEEASIPFDSIEDVNGKLEVCS